MLFTLVTTENTPSDGEVRTQFRFCRSVRPTNKALHHVTRHNEKFCLVVGGRRGGDGNLKSTILSHYQIAVLNFYMSGWIAERLEKRKQRKGRFWRPQAFSITVSFLQKRFSPSEGLKPSNSKASSDQRTAWILVSTAVCISIDRQILY